MKKKTKSSMREVPVDANKVSFLTLAGGPTDLLAVVIGSEVTGLTGYDAGYEYWFDGVSQTASESDLTLLVQQISDDLQESIDNFVDGSSLAFSARQVESVEDWIEGTYVPGSAAQLYSATDPDDEDPDIRIGLVIEKSTAGDLVGITWYRTDKEILTVCSELPAALPFNLETGTNPSVLGQGPWFYVHEPST